MAALCVVGIFLMLLIQLPPARWALARGGWWGLGRESLSNITNMNKKINLDNKKMLLAYGLARAD